MSGHSKWNNIKRKKEKTDGAKAKIFTKIGRELAVAVKQGGGPDPASNSKLKDCIAKAKAANVPNDNIERIIKKAAGDNNADNYEAITYEGYGPNGVAVIVETLTDNRNRTAADVRQLAKMIVENSDKAVCFLIQEGDKAKVVIAKGAQSSYDLTSIKRLLMEKFQCKGGGSAMFMEFGGAYSEAMEAALQEMIDTAE